MTMRVFARQPVRAILLLLVVALCITPSASARKRTIAPPGNSGISQYLESIPTASGSRPTNTLHGSVGVPPGSGGGGGGVSSATAKSLAAQGADGLAATSLARATAPSVRPRRGAAIGTGAASGSMVAATLGAGRSPASSVFKALTGSSAGGGLGPILPAVLIASLVGAAGLALLRRRTT
jgi:hypothetical protein